MERLPPSPGSARVGRQVVAALLTALGRDDLVDDAELVVSELVANAVMHARTELGLSVQASGGGVRVAVTDGSTVHPRWTPASSTAISGRGLVLVQRLCSEWGVEVHPDGGKTVWALVDHPSGGIVEHSSEDLLALWSDRPDEPPSSADPQADDALAVVLEVDVAAMLASRSHTEDLTRELQLIALGAHRHPVPARLLELARRLAEATEAFHGPRRQMLTQSSRAAQRGEVTTTLHLHLQPGDADAAVEWSGALDEADALTTDSVLLLPRSPPSMTEFRRRYIAAIVDAVNGRPPEG